MEVQCNDEEATGDEIAFGCPPLYVCPGKSRSRTTENTAKSKLHCDLANTIEDDDVIKPTFNNSKVKRPELRYANVKQKEECLQSKGSSATSLCDELSKISFTIHEEFDSSSLTSSDSDTLKEDSTKNLSTNTQKQSTGKRESLNYRQKGHPFYVREETPSRKRLRSQSADVQTDPEQTSVCSCCLNFEDVDTYDRLVASELTPETTTLQDQDGDTILHLAIINECLSLVSRILRVVRQPSLLNITNTMKQTPLHLAVLTQQAHIIRLLLSRGASIETRDRNGNTALHLACKRGDVSCVEQLTKPLHHSEIDSNHYHVPFQRIPQDPTILNYDGQSCVHLAASSGSMAVLDHLIKPTVGHSINIRHGLTGRTVLHEAVYSRNLHLLIHLLRNKHVYRLDIDCEAFDGSTPLQMAICNGYSEAASELKKHGATQDERKME